MLGIPLPQTVGHKAQDVGVMKEAMHVCFSLGVLSVLLLVTQDSLQGVEVSIM